MTLDAGGSQKQTTDSAAQTRLDAACDTGGGLFSDTGWIPEVIYSPFNEDRDFREDETQLPADEGKQRDNQITAELQK